MSDERWIIVPNWDRFQHYGDRDPVWIKVYTVINSRDDWTHLTLAERGLLVTVWVEYARSGGRLRVSDLRHVCRTKVYLRSVERLSEAGLIELSASKPLALARSREKEEEEDKKKKGDKSRGKPRKGVTGWRLVKGSHGLTHVPDPNGTDRPPVDAPNPDDVLKEVPK